MVIDNESIYMFVTPTSSDSSSILQLTEISTAEKIKILLEKSLFKEAEIVASNARCSEEIKAQIAKEHADQHYTYQRYDKAM